MKRQPSKGYLVAAVTLGGLGCKIKKAIISDSLLTFSVTL